METKYLIIGNSITAVSAIEAIRGVDTKGKIIVVSDEPILNYSRPLISYYLGNKVPREKLSFKDKNFYAENKVTLLLNTRAEKLDTKKKEVYLSRGSKVKFQKLLVATGGKPIMPAIEGLNKQEGIFTFTKFEDVEKLIDYIEEKNIEEAVVLGAGLIGLKCTEGLLERGIKVTIIELADRILANTFDADASGLLESALEKSGCEVIKEDTIVKVSKETNKIKKITLKSRKEIHTALLVIAVGVSPNIALVKDTAIKTNRGIIVNSHLETSVKDIYAAGDVAEAKDFLSQNNAVIAIWPIASRQGRTAGLNIAGEPTTYEGLFIMNSVELAGIPTISFGITYPTANGFEVLTKKDEVNNCYRKIVLKNNRIVGAIFLGKIERAGIFCGLIKDQVDVSSFKQELLNDDFGLLVLPADYRKHLVVGEGIEI